MSTRLPCSFDKCVHSVKKSSLLHHVSSPLITFSPIEGSFPDEWMTGTFWTRIYLFGILPFPKQAIVITLKQEEGKFTLQDSGFSSLIMKWDHKITVSSLSQNEVTYQDTVDIRAGLITPMIWLFSYVLFSYRQYRLRRLVKMCLFNHSSTF